MTPRRTLALVLACAMWLSDPRAEIAWSADLSFETRTLERVALQPFAIVAVDFDRDGKTDLGLTDGAGNSLVTLRGNGDGTFLPPTQIPAGDLPRGLASGDLDSDGHPDVIVALSHSDAIAVFLNDGNGILTGGIDYYAAGTRPFAVTVGDVDEDGALDVAIANETNVGPPVDGTVTVFRGTGNGRLTRYLQLSAGRYPADVQLADLNGDRHLDLIVANWGSNDATTFLGDGRGNFGSRATAGFDGVSPFSVAVADLNADARLDLLLPDLQGKRSSVLLGDGTGRFRFSSHVPTGVGCRSLAVADFNGDGRPDVAAAATNADTVDVSLGGGFTEAKSLPVGRLPRWITAADLNGDGRVDLAVTNLSSQSLTVLLNVGPVPKSPRREAAAIERPPPPGLNHGKKTTTRGERQ